MPGDLEIQRQLGQPRGLHYPVQPARVEAVLTGIDIFESRLLAQRLQRHDRGIRAPQGGMRARCDDQRQTEFARTVNREPDEIVTVLVDTGLALSEGLLQTVGDDDDLVVLAQLPPDLFRIVRGQHAAFRHVEESGMRHFPEVQAVLGVSQPDRYRDGVVFGEETGQLD